MEVLNDMPKATPCDSKADMTNWSLGSKWSIQIDNSYLWPIKTAQPVNLVNKVQKFCAHQQNGVIQSNLPVLHTNSIGHPASLTSVFLCPRQANLLNKVLAKSKLVDDAKHLAQFCTLQALKWQAHYIPHKSNKQMGRKWRDTYYIHHFF